MGYFYLKRYLKNKEYDNNVYKRSYNKSNDY